MSHLPGLNYQLGEDIDALRDAVYEFEIDLGKTVGGPDGA